MILHGIHQHPKATTVVRAGSSCVFKPHISPMAGGWWFCAGLGHSADGPTPDSAYAAWLRSLRAYRMTMT